MGQRQRQPDALHALQRKRTLTRKFAKPQVTAALEVLKFLRFELGQSDGGTGRLCPARAVLREHRVALGDEFLETRADAAFDQIEFVFALAGNFR